MRSFLIVSSLLFSYASGIAQSLQKHQWKDRVILLFAENEGHDQFIKQLPLLQANKAELIDRDLVTYQIFDQKATGPGDRPMTTKWADQLRSRYNRDEKPFFFVLIGKDGGVKLRSDEVVQLQKLFALIDGMPMRQAEMRRKGKN